MVGKGKDDSGMNEGSLVSSNVVTVVINAVPRARTLYFPLQILMFVSSLKRNSAFLRSFHKAEVFIRQYSPQDMGVTWFFLAVQTVSPC